MRTASIITAASLAALLTGCEKPDEPLPPEGFAARATLSTNILMVGDPVTLTLTARHPSGSTIRFPNIGNSKETVVQNRSAESRKISKSILESEEVYRLTSFRTGDRLLITGTVVCVSANGEEKTQTLPGLILHVQSSLNATNAAKLSDIKDIIKPPLRLSPNLWVPLLMVLLALIAGLLTLAFLRKPRTILQMAPPEPPHIIARRALEALRSKPWKPEPFFTELSLILRSYLENRFNLNAPESTTEELSRTLPGEHKERLLPFFEQADLVKFARADAERDIMQTAFSTVEQFISQTSPTDQTDYP
jgi:hypothetical protein